MECSEIAGVLQGLLDQLLLLVVERVREIDIELNQQVAKASLKRKSELKE